MNERKFSIAPRDGEGSVIQEHLVLNVLSRLSALIEIDVIESQKLIVALGRYVHVSSSAFRAVKSPFLGDVEEIILGLKMLGLMRGVVIDVILAPSINLHEIANSYPIFRDFHRWFDSAFLMGNVSKNYAITISLLGAVEGLTIGISVSCDELGQGNDVTWCGILENRVSRQG